MDDEKELNLLCE